MNFDKFGENLGEGTKEVINELEARRIARAREAGLPDDSTEEDIKTVMEKTSCSREKAVEKLKETEGDLAQAIIELSK